MLRDQSVTAEKPESKPTPKPTKQIRRQFTEKQKAKVIAYAKEHGVANAGRHFDITTGVVSRWVQDTKRRPTAARYSEAFKAKVVAYAREHGAVKAAEKYGPHNSAIYNWMQKDRKPAPHTKNVEKREQKRVPGNAYLLARKLAGEVKLRLQATGELDNLVIYADMLVKEILK